MKSVKVILTSFSDPTGSDPAFAERLMHYLQTHGIETDPGMAFLPWCTFREKAEYFNRICRTDEFDWMIDISGGNLANGMLEWVDFDAYARSKTRFIGFSDLSSLINALAARTGKAAFLMPPYYLQDLHPLQQLLESGSGPCTEYRIYIPPAYSDSFALPEKFYGGNIRCFLKLAGTPCFPDVQGCGLFLEGNSTSIYELLSLGAQLKQTGIFEKADCILFGYFNRIYQDLNHSSFEALAEFWTWYLEQLEVTLPFALTLDIGHIPDSRGIWI